MKAAWTRFAGGIRALLHPMQADRELDEELQAYLEASAARKVAGGLPPEEALRIARAEMGSAEAVKDHVRDAGWESLVEACWLDVRYAWGMLMRTPAFTAVAVLVLALGIGASTSIFSALDAVLLRPLPYPEADRLVDVFEVNDTGRPNGGVSGGVFRDWEAHSTSFDGLVLTGPLTANLRSADTLERVTGLEVTSRFLRVFGLQPLLGRGFLAGEETYGGPTDVVLITEELWDSHFGRDAAIVGRTIVLDDVPRTVIGILPRGALPHREIAFFVPAVLAPGSARAGRSSHWATVIGRLKRGVTLREADAELQALRARLAGEYPVYKQRWGVGVRPLHEMLVSGPTRAAGTPRQLVLVLVACVGLVLLIACANIAGLLLARAQHRQPEIALRAALGAGAGRIVRQVLTESLVLAAIGGAAGVALAYWGVELLRRLTLDMLPQALTPRLDGRVLVFSVLVTVVTGVLFGVLPALRARRPDVNDALKRGGRSATGAGRHRTQSMLVAGEIALTVVLLVSAGLLLRSLARMGAVDPGFDPDRVLAFDLSLPTATYPSPDERLAFSRGLLGRIRALPGVDAAGAGQAIPFAGGGYGEYVRRPDQPADRDIVIGRVDFVSEGYLEALGIRLLGGRPFRDADNRPDARVAVISETTAATFFADRDPLGEPLVVAGQTYDVIGVMADTVYRALDADRQPFIYLPQALDPSVSAIVVRAGGDPLSLAAAVRRELRRLDPGLAMANARSLDQSMSDSMSARRVVLGLIGGFGVAALALACVGLYGLMAYSVATRRRELCIRMALGAVRRDVIGLVLRDGMRLTAIGVGAGLVAAAGASRLLASQLFQIREFDPAAIAGAVVVVTVVALLACWLPARRGSLASPMSVLRAE